ncbi:MAG: BrnT family toxin [Candidatus Curtissbacteria bacterium]|nr:BrnT family toxin [Candidatus Curtissbacteria bacterium]
MKILSEPITFDWDKSNIDKNLIKHGVTYQETEEVFGNQPLLLNVDSKHSDLEIRYQVLGKTSKNRLLFVSFTIRNQKVRPISFRDMSKKERRVYEKKTKNSS